MLQCSVHIAVPFTFRYESSGRRLNRIEPNALTLLPRRESAVRAREKGTAVSQPIASWIERFANRVIMLRPGVMPLEAVRHATEAWDTTSGLPPEKAADTYLATTPLPLGTVRH